MKKRIVTFVLVSALLVSGGEVLGTVTSSENANAEAYVKNISLAEDVFIDGLYDNSVLYVGANLSIKGYVDQQATQQEISWQITGNKEVIEFDASGNQAKITGKTAGSVWVMARATDGSDRAREYTVNVSDYPADYVSQSIIGKDITPILKRPFEGNTTILRVEVSKRLTGSKEREEALVDYLRKLASLGTLSNEKKYSDNDYEYYILDVNSQKVEVRVSANEVSLKNILVDVSRYNNENTESGENENLSPLPPNNLPSEGTEKPAIEEVLPPSNEEEMSIPSKVPVDEVTQGIDHIIIIGGTGISSDDPIIVALEDSLTTHEKIATMERYLTTLQRSKRLGFVRKADQANFTSYIFQVSPRLSVGRSVIPNTKNDFFIEIRVNKDDEEAYIPIIEMLDNLEEQEVEDTTAKVDAQEIKEVAQLEEELVEGTYEDQSINKEGHNQEDTLKQQEEKEKDRKSTKNISVMIIVLLGVLVGIRKLF